MMLANLRRMRGEHRGAIEAMQRLVDLPNKPLGMEGWHLLNSRIGARLTQAEAALSLYEAETDGPARARLLEEAKGYREALAALVPSDSPFLLKIDARTAYLEGRWQEAERLLIATNQRTGGSDREVMWWLSQTELNLGKLGEARRMLEALDELAPDNPQYMVAMAGVEIELRNLDAAKGIARELMALFPEDPEVQRIVRAIEGTDDPVRTAYERYRATAEGGNGVLGDPDAALAGLREDFEAAGHNPQIGQMLVQAYMGRREVGEALWAAERILESHPDQTGFERIASALRHGEYLPAQVEIITTGPWPEVEKATMLWMVYKQEGMEAEAGAQLEAARRAEPSSPMVINLRFQDALDRGDMAGLNQVVADARRHNADGQGGETYALRALIAEGKHREAVTLGERLVTGSPNDSTLWYLLGVERTAVGRLDEAETALRRSIEISPNNVMAVMELCGLLSARGQDAAALTVANAAEPFGRLNLEFVHMLLTLEARAGNRQAALEQREALRARHPELLGNNVALAELYMDLGRWADARTLIDELRAGGDRLGLVNLDARWHADQGDFEGAGGAFEAYIASGPEVERPTQPYIAWALFMQSREQFGLAERALEAGRAHQDPATME
jgi:tetratricopeptide (TPR) repeat protein